MPLCVRVGELLWYKGTRLHTIKPGNQIEGGDIVVGDGTGRAFVSVLTGDKVGWNTGGLLTKLVCVLGIG